MREQMIEEVIEEYGCSYKADDRRSARQILEDMHQQMERSIFDLGRDIVVLRERIEHKEKQIKVIQDSQANTIRAILVLTKEGL